MRTPQSSFVRSWTLRLVGGVFVTYLSAVIVAAQLASLCGERALFLFYPGIIIAMPTALIVIFALPPSGKRVSGRSSSTSTMDTPA